MTTIVTRSGKGSALSWNEVDNNFTNLNTDKADTSVVALKAPIDSPTFTGTVSGITKTMVGLGNVDNTSDATKDAATTTLTNKTITSPKIKAGQFGNSDTATNNFTITAELADGTMKLARGNAGATTQDVMTVDVNGKVAFPQNPVQTGPAFAATDTATTSSAGATVQVVFDTELFDTDNAFDGTTFNPQVAGYYQVNASVAMGGNTSTSSVTVTLRKNATNYMSIYSTNVAGFGVMAQLATLVYMNGTSDTLDVQGRNSSNANLGISTFSAALIRVA